MTNEEKAKLKEELNGKTTEELVEIIISMKDDLNLTNSIYKTYMAENEQLRNALNAVRSVMSIINI